MTQTLIIAALVTVGIAADILTWRATRRAENSAWHAAARALMHADRASQTAASVTGCRAMTFDEAAHHAKALTREFLAEVQAEEQATAGQQVEQEAGAQR